jgi:hypothetical protein
MSRFIILGFAGLAILTACATGTEMDSGDAPASGGNTVGNPTVLTGDSGPSLGQDSGGQPPLQTDTPDSGAPTSTTPPSEDSGSIIPTPPPSEDSGSFPSDDSGSGDFDGGSSDDDAGSADCKGYAPPDAVGSCTACSSSSSSCQNNGCYGGYWCDLSTSACHKSPPSGC